MWFLLTFAFLTQAAEAPSPSAAQQAHLRGNPGEWFSADSYPPEALAARKGGEVATLVSLDASGGITGCRITRSSGFGPLDQATCDRIVEHLSFYPATNDAGEPIAVEYPMHVYWRLPLTFTREGEGPCATTLSITPETTQLSQAEIDAMRLPADFRLCA